MKVYFSLSSFLFFKDDDEHFHHEVDEYDPKQYDEDFDKIESEDSLEHNYSFESNNLAAQKNFNKTEHFSPATPTSPRG